MWPFKKRAPEPERDWLAEGIAELKAFRDIGQTFNYLGRTCIVCSHTTIIGLLILPRLECDYVDDAGVIRRVMFSPQELPGLRAQNKESETETDRQQEASTVWPDGQ